MFHYAKAGSFCIPYCYNVFFKKDEDLFKKEAAVKETIDDDDEIEFLTLNK